LRAKLRLTTSFPFKVPASVLMAEAVVPIESLRAATVGTPTAHLRALAFCALMLGTFAVAWPYSEAAAGASAARCMAPASIGAAYSRPPASPAPASTHDLLNLAARSSPLDSSTLQSDRRWRPQRLSCGTALAYRASPGVAHLLAGGISSGTFVFGQDTVGRTTASRAPPAAQLFIPVSQRVGYAGSCLRERAVPLGARRGSSARRFTARGPVSSPIRPDARSTARRAVSLPPELDARVLTTPVCLPPQRPVAVFNTIDFC
jgi:hypothetical protein